MSIIPLFDDEVYNAMQQRRDQLLCEERSTRDQINKLFVRLVEIKTELDQYQEEFSLL